MASTELYPAFRNPLLGSPRKDLPRHIAIVGAGTIGPDIGYYFKTALPDITLTLIDVREEALAAVQGRFEGYAQKGIKRGKMTAEKAEKVLANVVTSTDYDALQGADLVIEAATESIPLKKKIFAMIEERVSAEAIITSNTSSIPAGWLFDDMQRPQRTTITHFFAPAWRNPAVEVISWPGAARGTVDYLRWLFAVTGKAPMVTDDVIAFMLDRIFDNWTNESAMLLGTSGSIAKQVDAVAEEFVHAGPFFVLNMANGNPITYECNQRQMQESPAYRPAEIFLSVDRWAVNRPGTPIEVAEDVRRNVRDRLLGILCSQSLDVVARRIGTPEDLHLGSLLALGFKRSPLDLMRSMGRDEVARVLGRLAEERPGLPGPELLDHYDQATSFDRFILVDRLDDVVVITLRRPAQMNALTDETNDEILRAIRVYEDDPAVTGFVIVGYGTRAFCAGAEIGKFTEMLGDAAAAAQYSRDSGRLLVHLDGMTKPVVAAVNGLALGGGMELATRCHDIVASPRAYFQLPEVTLGILPGIGGLVVPYRKWPAAAKTFTDMITRAERLTAAQALEIGVISGIEEEYDALVAMAAQRARELSGKLPLPQPDLTALLDETIQAGEAETPDGMPLSHEVVDIIVQAVRAGLEAPDLASALEAGYLAFGQVACTRAAQEGIGAFLAGRKPDFSNM
ncbi:MAG: 3-hydroxyacyl-CoA dehydrogenase NAD-binding domain-containing protein [Thermoleophilia bacterium]|nr:3-hydroxyacyl-CoA dehydrogenase NAD-binding domain-containing protein [Thermoleophilia bacterium]